MLNRLKFGDWAAELFSLLRVAERGIVSALSDADGKSGDRNSPPVEDTQAVDKSSPVALARMPSLFSFLPTRNPGVSFSMIKAEIPCCEADRSVTNIATQTSA
jgi:hypothetical protein